MFDFKGFRKANKLTQEEVGRYLGVGKTFICNVEKGLSKLPKVHLESLLNNNRGWDVSLITEQQQNLVNFEFTEQTDTTDSPIIPSQVLEEMTASRQLAEQALAMVQEQLEAKQQTILAVREQLATTQEQLTTSQEQLTAEQQQTSTAQMHTTAALEESRQSRKQVDELIIMLKNSEIKLEREMEKMERRIEELANKRMEHDDDRGNSHKAHNKNDA